MVSPLLFSSLLFSSLLLNHRQDVVVQYLEIHSIGCASNLVSNSQSSLDLFQEGHLEAVTAGQMVASLI
jgi:hypothetical protein